MSRYVIRRLIGAVPLLLGVAILSFVFMQLAPGSPDDLYARNTRMSETQLATIRHNMGLDQPAYIQLVHWISNLVQGDLGMSYSQYRPVSTVIWDVFPNTVILVMTGLALSLVAALFFGVLAAVRPYGIFDTITSVLSYFGLAMPVLLVRIDVANPLCRETRLGCVRWDAQRPRRRIVGPDQALNPAGVNDWRSAVSPAGVATFGRRRSNRSIKTMCEPPGQRGCASSRSSGDM